MDEDENATQLVGGKWRSIGKEQVFRFLPSVRRRTVGPFVFVDHVGARPAGGSEARPIVDVPPHPHIGIATVTYLFQGALFHRDSIGSEQLIEPGAVNWMSSGRGIVHSERTPKELRASPPHLYGVQSWVALPKNKEDSAPSFQHVPASELPVLQKGDITVRLIAGMGFGMESPVLVASPLWCAALECSAAGLLMIPADHEERAILALDAAVSLNGEVIPAGTMAVLPTGAVPKLSFAGPGRAFLIGGASLPEKRYLDWNFCSTRPQRIEEAKQLYRKGDLGEIPGDGPNLPLPEDVR